MLGVVTGMRAEARCLGQGAQRVVCSGGDPARARSGVRRLIEQGVAGLVSFGLAGGLAPQHATGTLLLPEIVVLPTGRRLRTDAGWRQRLVRLAEAQGLAPVVQPLAGSDRLLATPAAKRSLFAATAAAAVDMESHALAEAAVAAGLPFVVIRVIADRADHAIPAIAQTGLGADGRIRPWPVLTSLLRQPGALVPVLRLGRASGRALAVLGRVAALAPDLACR